MHAPRSRALALLAVALAWASGCGAADNSPPAAVTTTAPPNTTAAPARLAWETYRGIRLPRSPIDGPANAATPVSTGYSQTPQGAILAAVRGQAALAMAADDEWGTVLSTVTAPGPGRTEFATTRAVLSVDGTLPADVDPKFTAFKMTSYRSDAATLTAGVQIVIEVGAPAQRFAYPIALQWISGDWRIVLPTTAENVDAIEVPTLDGYTLFEGA